MTAQVLHSPSHLPSSSPPTPRPAAQEDSELGLSLGSGKGGGGGGGKEAEQLSLLAVLVAVFRKSLVGCRTAGREELCAGMEIGCPTDVRHVAHVTFDRFNGFLGLPVEFEPEVPRRAPSARFSLFFGFWVLRFVKDAIFFRILVCLFLAWWNSVWLCL